MAKFHDPHWIVPPSDCRASSLFQEGCTLAEIRKSEEKIKKLKRGTDHLSLSKIEERYSPFIRELKGTHHQGTDSGSLSRPTFQGE